MACVCIPDLITHKTKFNWFDHSKCTINYSPQTNSQTQTHAHIYRAALNLLCVVVLLFFRLFCFVMCERAPAFSFRFTRIYFFYIFICIYSGVWLAREKMAQKSKRPYTHKTNQIEKRIINWQKAENCEYNNLFFYIWAHQILFEFFRVCLCVFFSRLVCE